MIKLETKNRLQSMPSRMWQDECYFSSNDRKWNLFLHDPKEWHMGADGWQAKLYFSDTDVTTEHPLLKKLNGGKGLHNPERYRPWCQSKPILALHAWDSTIYIYNPKTKSQTSRGFKEFPIDIQWSPTGDHLLLNHEGAIRVLDATGHDVQLIEIVHPKYEYPDIFWHPDGKQIITIGRSSRMEKTKLSFFNSIDGKLLDSADLDPSDLLPYDTESYEKIDRDKYSLSIGKGSSCVGYLLDKWSRVEFDASNHTLKLSVYRPESPIKEKNGEKYCHASEKGIEIKLSV